MQIPVCVNSLHPSIKFTLEMQKEDKTIPFLDVLLIQEDGSLGQKVYRKPTHTDRYLHYNSLHHPSIKNSVCKTLIYGAKTICEVGKIEGELEHLRSVLKMNGYPKKFIDNAMKTQQQYRKRPNISPLSVYHILVQLHIKSKGF